MANSYGIITFVVGLSIAMYVNSFVRTADKNFGEQCDPADDICNYEGGICDTDACGCNSDYEPDTSNLICSPLASVGAACMDDGDCIGNHEVCVSFGCECDTGYVENANNVCKAKPGTPCDTPSECNGDHNYCLGSQSSMHCACAFYAELAESGDSCFLRASALGQICDIPLQCTMNDPNSHCGPSWYIHNHCACNPGHVDTNGNETRGGSCKAEPGEGCSDTTDCYGEHVECTGSALQGKLCSCNAYAHIDPSGKFCSPKTSIALGEICLTSEQCTNNDINSECTTASQAVCTCKHGYIGTEVCEPENENETENSGYSLNTDNTWIVAAIVVIVAIFY